MARRIAQAVALAVVSSTTMAQEKSQGSNRTLLSRRTYEVKEDFGAVGDGKNDDTKNIQKAFDKLKEGNSDLHFKKGNYLCSNLELENVKNSKITFDKGAEMFVLKKLSHWQTSSQSGKYMSWLNIHDCEQLTIQGGTWNGDYDWWASQLPSHDHDKYHGNPRPQMIDFNVKGFTATDITINNAMGVHMKGGGSDINLSNLKFRTRSQTDNTGGILLCQVDGATVSHVDAQVNDDCLKVCDHAHDVTFEHSTCTNGHGLTIGGGNSKMDIDKCTWRDIDVIGGRHGPRIKWTTEAEGQIKNVLYEDIRMYNVQIPIVAESEYGHTSGRTEDTFHLGSITFKDITAKEDKNKGGHDEYKLHDLGFHCDSKASCKDIHLQNVHIDDPKAEWVCESCGGDMDSNVSPDASKYFDDKSSDDSRRRRRRLNPSPSPSSCSLEKQYSSASCKQGDTFGCDAGHVWINGGCRGRFTCDSTSGVECNDQSGKYVECSCSGSPSPSPDDRRRRRSSNDRRSSEGKSQTDDAEGSFGSDATFTV